VDGLPAAVGPALAALLVVAVLGKALDRGGWRILAVRAGSAHARGTALWLGVPAAELAAAGLLVAFPRAGLVAAAALLAALAAGVAHLRRTDEGAPCACFGPAVEGRIGRALVVRNAVLAAIALAAAPFAASTGPPPLAATAAGVGAVALALVAARLRQASARRPLAPGRRLRATGLTAGRPAIVVLLSPGCPPCEALAPHLRAVADLGRVPLLVGVGPGDRDGAISTAAGTLHRPGLWESVLRRHTVGGTPLAIAVGGDGRVRRAVAADVETLFELVAAVDEPPPRPVSRATAVRAVALAGAGVAVLALTAGSAAAARSRPPRRRRRPKADPWDYRDDARNHVDGDCAAFFRRISSPNGGVYAANGDRYAKTLGYADVEGFSEGCAPPPPANRLPTAASIDAKRVMRTWRGHCPCPTNMKQYTDESKCKVECPQGLACFGVQCVTDFEEWCVEVLYSIRATKAPQITLTSLQWRPPPSASPRCKVYANSFSRAIRTHEEQHARDSLDVLKEWENKNSRRYMRRCAPTQAEAEAAIAAAIEAEREAAYADLTRMDCERTKAFHQSQAGTTIVPRCEMCE
jgi:hypothetical protein